VDGVGEGVVTATFGVEVGLEGMEVVAFWGLIGGRFKVVAVAVKFLGLSPFPTFTTGGGDLKVTFNSRSVSSKILTIRGGRGFSCFSFGTPPNSSFKNC
jgi:hypothetical protein